MLPITNGTRQSSEYWTVSGQNIETLYTRTDWSRQARPYNLNLAYTKVRSATLRALHGSSLATTILNANIGFGITGQRPYDIVRGFTHSTTFTAANRLVSDVTDKAREKFISAMKGSAGIGVDLAERKQSMSMIEKRALQMYDFVRVLRRGRIQSAAKILGISDHPSYHKIVKNLTVRGQLRKQRFKNDILLNRKAQKAILTERDKTFSDLFLEFHFGWSPLVNDIYDSADVLQRPIASGRVSGHQSGRGSFGLHNVGGGYDVGSDHKLSVDVVVCATVSVSNPNLSLANQLGLINPAALAWEIVPFSFVVDWFVNVGDFLGSFTEFAGYNVTDPMTRTYVYDISTFKQLYLGQLDFGAVADCVSVIRSLGLPGVSLKVRTPWQLSPTRALTAISLLIQQGFGR